MSCRSEGEKLKERRVGLKKSVVVPALFSSFFVSVSACRIKHDQTDILHTDICVSTASQVSKEQMSVGAAKNA